MSELADFDLHLPDLGDTGDEREGVDDAGEIELTTPDDVQDDPFDDAVADDVPIEYQLATDRDEPSALGDDSLGVEGDGHGEGVAIAEDGEDSLIDSGEDELELELHGDDELGIDPIPYEEDDGGIEGLEDPAAQKVDTDEFPPLDGADDDDDHELDLGIELPGEPAD